VRDILVFSAVVDDPQSHLRQRVQLMAWRDYVKLAAKHCITHDALLEETRALHCAGSLLWFETTSSRDSFVVLDPFFIARAYCALTNVVHVHGVVTLTDLFHSLSDVVNVDRDIVVDEENNEESNSPLSSPSPLLNLSEVLAATKADEQLRYGFAQAILLLERYNCIWRVGTSDSSQARWLVPPLLLEHTSSQSRSLWPFGGESNEVILAQWRQVWQVKAFDATSDLAARLLLAVMNCCVDDLHTNAIWSDCIQLDGVCDSIDGDSNKGRSSQYKFLARLVVNHGSLDTLVLDSCCVRLPALTMHRSVDAGASRRLLVAPQQLLWHLVYSIDRLLALLGDDVDDRVNRFVVCGCRRCRGVTRFKVDDVWRALCVGLADNTHERRADVADDNDVSLQQQQGENQQTLLSSPENALLCHGIAVNFSKVWI
jgi:hypothetical protein